MLHTDSFWDCWPLLLHLFAVCDCTDLSSLLLISGAANPSFSSLFVAGGFWGSLPYSCPYLLLTASGTACPTPAPFCCCRLLPVFATDGFWSSLPYSCLFFAADGFWGCWSLSAADGFWAAGPYSCPYMLLMACEASGTYLILPCLLLMASGLQAPIPAPICC